MNNKQRLNKQRQNFLLTFFDEKEEYQEKYVRGFWLIKSYNKNKGNWQVAIFSKDSYENYKKAEINWQKQNNQ